MRLATNVRLDGRGWTERQRWKPRAFALTPSNPGHPRLVAIRHNELTNEQPPTPAPNLIHSSAPDWMEIQRSSW